MAITGMTIVDFGLRTWDIMNSSIILPFNNCKSCSRHSSINRLFSCKFAPNFSKNLFPIPNKCAHYHIIQLSNYLDFGHMPPPSRGNRVRRGSVI